MRRPNHPLPFATRSPMLQIVFLIAHEYLRKLRYHRLTYKYQTKTPFDKTDED